MTAALVWPIAEKRKRPLSYKSCGIIVLPWEENKRKITTKMDSVKIYLELKGLTVEDVTDGHK